MENASKALLIAAAVLIVVLLIAFGMRIFNQSATKSDVSGTASAMEVAQFNAQFTQYEGTISLSTLKQLVNVINMSNANTDSGRKAPYTCVGTYTGCPLSKRLALNTLDAQSTTQYRNYYDNFKELTLSVENSLDGKMEDFENVTVSFKKDNGGYIDCVVINGNKK